MAALRAQINALNLASARPDPFSTFEFYDNLLRRSSSSRVATARARFFAAFTDGELIGYLGPRRDHRECCGAGSEDSGF
jgi:hypothetical protein